MKIGILPFGRPTFDVPFAEEKLDAMLSALDNTGHEIIGQRALLFDADATMAAVQELTSAAVDQLLLLQVTFTDASLTIKVANEFNVPISIWAVPEPRMGGRLRLNAFCGLNLASHALGLNGRDFSWLYADTTYDIRDKLDSLFSGKLKAGKILAKQPKVAATTRAMEIAKDINGKRIGRIGEHPVGFDTCAYSASAIKELAGVTVDELELDTLFNDALAVPLEEITEIRSTAGKILSGLDSVDQGQLDKSFRLKFALDDIRDSGKYDAFAIRCWPETFTEYGGAVCGPVSMLGQARVPCACEADVYGALTQLILQAVANEPVFLADLVDVDVQDNTGIVWHCGQAPISMCDEGSAARATIHTNRKMPLLFEFPLKPGRVTFMRISQSFGEHKMIISAGEMLQRPMAFTGTSGVVKFDNQAAVTLNNIIDSGLEHHMALAYGDHTELLHSVAAALNLQVLEI